MRLDNDSFLFELSKLYSAAKEGGAVTVCMKRVTYRRAVDPNQCVVRASFRDRKISTEISAAQAPKFSSSLSLVLMASADNLKKRKKAPKRIQEAS